jgi:ribose 1,5-bisphosphokinase PhnN
MYVLGERERERGRERETERERVERQEHYTIRAVNISFM